MCKPILILATILSQLFLSGISKSAGRILINKDSSAVYLSASETSNNLGKIDGTLICWLDNSFNGSIRIQKLNTDLRFEWDGGGIVVDSNLGELFDSGTDYPLIFSDNQGGAIMIYRKKSIDREDIFAQKIFPDGHFMRNPVCLSAGYEGYNFSPSAVVTADSKIAVVWENFSDGNFDIHAQKIDLDCNRLWNSGREIVIAPHSSDQRLPVAACSRDLIFISWLDARNHSSDYMFDMYACKIEKDGYVTEKEKLIYHNRIIKYNKSFAGITDERKNLLFNHNIVVSSDNSFIAALEDSRDNVYSRIRVIKVDEQLNVQWEKIFPSYSFQTKPLITGDGNGGANVFWRQISEGNYGIYAAEINSKGEKVWGGESGMNIANDGCKDVFPRLMPCPRNKNGILLNNGKIFLSWVTDNYEKLFMKSINLTGESNQVGFTDEIQNEINDGECTSITMQMNNLIIVYIQSNSLYAAVRKFHNANLNRGFENVRIENFPNPFNPATHIVFNIPFDGFVRLSIYDIAGRNLGKLVNEFRKAGSYSVVFDASVFGNGLSSGVYFCRLESNGYVRTIRMTLIK